MSLKKIIKEKIRCNKIDIKRFTCSTFQSSNINKNRLNLELKNLLKEARREKLNKPCKIQAEPKSKDIEIKVTNRIQTRDNRFSKIENKISFTYQSDKFNELQICHIKTLKDLINHVKQIK